MDHPQLLVQRAIEKTLGQPVAIEPDDLLRDLGITSLLLFQFVGMLEEQMGIEIPDSLLMPEHFVSVSTVAELVTSLPRR